MREKSEIQYRNLIETINGIAWEFDLASMQFTYVSPHAERILGYPLKHWTDLESWKQMLHPDDRYRAADYCANMTSALKDHNFEYRILKSDGGILWLHDIVTVNQDKQGRPASLTGIMIDITDRKATEFSLRDSRNTSEARLRESQRIARLGQWELDLITDQLIWSDEIFRIFELNPDEFPASYEAFLNIIHPDDRDVVNSAYSNSLKTKEPYEITHRLLMRDGRVKYVNEICRTEYADDGTARRSIGTVQDITRLKIAELELKQLTDRLGLAVESGGIGIWDLHLATNTLIWDNQMFLLYGEKREGAETELKGWRERIHPQDRRIIDEVMRDALKSAQRFDIEYRINWPDNTTHYLRSCALVKCDDDGNPTRMIGINYDITEQKEMEITSKKAQQEAESANHAKSAFLSNMSHEIRTPMNSILGFTDILLEKESDPDKRHFIETIHASGHALLSLINDILDLSKIEAGKLDLNFGSIIFRSLINEIRAIFDQKVREKNLEFIIETDHAVPEILLMDETRIRQVLLNLISNAIKFTDKGRILLHTSVRSSQCDGNVSLQITVEDTGIGIPPEKQTTIFDAFEQVQSTHSRQYGGTGLGLAITHKLIKAMGGDISVQSNRNEGSKFTINLPNVQLSTTAPHTENHCSFDYQNIAFEPATIIIADDIDYNREMLATYLERWNFQLLFAEEGTQVLDLAEENRPDLILLDIQMPGMNGYETIHLLNSVEAFRSIPVIAVTAAAMKEEQVRIEKVCDGYLRKPVTKIELVEEVMKFLPHAYSVEAPAEVCITTEEQCSDPISKQVIQSLKDAALSADIDEIRFIADQLETTHLHFAQMIHHACDQFDYENVLALCATR